jgi:hypothetical protein
MLQAVAIRRVTRLKTMSADDGVVSWGIHWLEKSFKRYNEDETIVGGKPRSHQIKGGLVSLSQRAGECSKSAVISSDGCMRRPNNVNMT